MSLLSVLLFMFLKPSPCYVATEACHASALTSLALLQAYCGFDFYHRFWCTYEAFVESGDGPIRYGQERTCKMQ